MMGLIVAFALAGAALGWFALPYAADVLLRRAYGRSASWWWESCRAYGRFKGAGCGREPSARAPGEEGALGLWREDAQRAALAGALPRERAQALVDVGMAVDPGSAVRSEADQRRRCTFVPRGWQRACCLAAGAACAAVPAALGLGPLSGLALSVCMFALAAGVVCDLRARILPLESCAAVAAGGALFQLGEGGPEVLAVGAAFGAACVLVCLAANRLFCRTGAVPVGRGDVRCMAALSLASGGFAPLGFAACYVAAAVFALVGMALGRLSLRSGVPMGPFLALWLGMAAIAPAM